MILLADKIEEAYGLKKRISSEKSVAFGNHPFIVESKTAAEFLQSASTDRQLRIKQLSAYLRQYGPRSRGEILAATKIPKTTLQRVLQHREIFVPMLGQRWGLIEQEDKE